MVDVRNGVNKMVRTKNIKDKLKSINIPAYYAYIGKRVHIDVDSMRDEFEQQLKILKVKASKIKLK